MPILFYRIGNRGTERLFRPVEIYPPHLPGSDRPRNRGPEKGYLRNRSLEYTSPERYRRRACSHASPVGNRL